MKCQLCNQNEANLQVKQVINGDVREIAVCRECAAKSGLKESSVPMLTDFLFGIGMKPQAQPLDEDKACAECHMRYSDFRKGSLLGCPACYESFAAELEPLLDSIHEGDRHVGKAPAGEVSAAEIAGLKKRLSRAVTAQDFEQAAQLRDRLREIEGGQQAGAAIQPPAGAGDAD
jgi:protein arginine kinase activator